MKNMLIVIFLSATVALGALCLRRQKETAELQAQLAAVQSQLAEKAEAEDSVAHAEQKLKAMPDALANAQDALAHTSKIAVNKTKLAGELAQSLAAAKTNDGNPLAAMTKDPKMRPLMVSQQKAMFGPLLAKQYADFFKWLNLTPEQSATLIDLKSFAQLELSYCHHRDGPRPGSIADAIEPLRTATKPQFGELKVPSELTTIAWDKGLRCSTVDPIQSSFHLVIAL